MHPGDIATFLMKSPLRVFIGIQIPGALHRISNVDGWAAPRRFYCPCHHRRQRIVNAEAGFLGTASLAVPFTTLSGTLFSDRSRIIFVVTVILLVTLLLQRSTLPAVIR